MLFPQVNLKRVSHTCTGLHHFSSGREFLQSSGITTSLTLSSTSSLDFLNEIPTQRVRRVTRSLHFHPRAPPAHSARGTAPHARRARPANPASGILARSLRQSRCVQHGGRGTSLQHLPTGKAHDDLRDTSAICRLASSRVGVSGSPSLEGLKRPSRRPHRVENAKQVDEIKHLRLEVPEKP